MTQKYCVKCGNPVQPKDLFCVKCGFPLGSKNTAPQNSNERRTIKDATPSIDRTTNYRLKNDRVKKAKHIESQYMRLKIVHKEVSNIATGTMGKTWNERKIKFVWNITRPETGMDTFSANCPDCGEGLKINVTSTPEFKSQVKKARTNGIALITGSLIFGLCIYIFNKVDNQGLLILCIFGFMFCFCFGLIELGNYAGNPWGLVATGSLLSGGLLNENAAGPHNQHYIETIESLRT